VPEGGRYCRDSVGGEDQLALRENGSGLEPELRSSVFEGARVAVGYPSSARQSIMRVHAWIAERMSMLHIPPIRLAPAGRGSDSDSADAPIRENPCVDRKEYPWAAEPFTSETIRLNMGHAKIRFEINILNACSEARACHTQFKDNS